LSKQGLVSIANGTARDVDLLVGTNADEWHLPRPNVFWRQRYT
jgi:hypothetical protein